MSFWDNVLRIAQTGDTEPRKLRPVDNIMQMQNARPQTASLWDKAKQSAGSVWGRNALGGLGTAAAVALSGGDFGDALGYGIMGAGNTMKRQNEIKDYNNEMAKKALDRVDELSEAKKKREFEMQMLDKQVAAQKEMADYSFQQALRQLRAKQDMQDETQNKLNADRDNFINGLNLSDEEKAKLRNSAMAAQYGLKLPEDEKAPRIADAAVIAQKGGVMLDPEALNRGEVKYMAKPQTTSGDAYLLNKMLDSGMQMNEALDRLGKMTPEERTDNAIKLQQAESNIKTLGNIARDNNQYQNNLGLENLRQQGRETLAGLKADNQRSLAGYNADLAEQKAQNDYTRDIELLQYKNSLPTDEQRNISYTAQTTGIPEKDLYSMQLERQRADIANINSQIENRGREQVRPTAQMQNYDALIKQGVAPAKAQELAFGNGGVNVSVNNSTGANAFQREFGKNAAKTVQDYIEAGQKAQRQLNSLREVSSAIDNPDVYQGIGGSLVNNGKKLAASMGKDVKGLADTAVLQAGTAELMGQIRNSLLPGAMSDRDLTFLQNMVPGVNQTAEQNRAILHLYEKAAQRQADMSRKLLNYVNNNGGVLDAQGLYQLQQEADTPLFTEEEKRAALTGENYANQQNNGINNTGGDPLGLF